MKYLEYNVGEGDTTIQLNPKSYDTIVGADLRTIAGALNPNQILVHGLFQEMLTDLDINFRERNPVELLRHHIVDGLGEFHEGMCVPTSALVIPAVASILDYIRNQSLNPVERVQRSCAVRRMEPKDFEDLFEVWTDLTVQRQTLTPQNLSLAQANERVQRFLNDSNKFCFVAEVDGRVVGFASLDQSSSEKQSHVASFTIMVKEGYQGYGIGKALYNARIDYADNVLGLDVLELRCQITNLLGLMLYQQFDFKVDGVLQRRTRTELVFGDQKKSVRNDLFTMSRHRDIDN